MIVINEADFPRADFIALWKRSKGQEVDGLKFNPQGVTVSTCSNCINYNRPNSSACATCADEDATPSLTNWEPKQ